MKAEYLLRKGIFTFLLFFGVLSLQAKETKLPVVIDGDKVSYLHQNKKVVAEGNVMIKYEDIVISCDKAIYNAQDNIAKLIGNLKITSPKSILYADSGEYNFNAKKATIKDIRIESLPFYGGAKEAQRVSENKYILKGGYVTTCNLEKPHYRLVAKRIIVYPKRKIEAKSVTLYVGKIPIFYLPYYAQPINDKSFPVELSPGKSKDWGYYILSRYRYYFSNNNKGKILFDWYEDRGLGSGITHFIESKELGNLSLRLYYIEDKIYDKQHISKYPKSSRYKGQFSYSLHREGFSIVSEFNKFSDKDFMKDFFFREYENNPHPFSYILWDVDLGNSSLSMLVQKRANRFFDETEYLPKIEYNFYNQRISSYFPLYLASSTSFSNLTKKRANSGIDDDSLRFHTKNIFTLRTNIKHFDFNPYVGLYATYYSKNIYSQDVERLAFTSGFSLSTKLYKIFDVDFSLFGRKVSKMRHIITPILSYEYIHDPTVSKDNLFQFDTIDELSRKDTITFTLENKLQAKNDEKVWDFLYFAPSLEYKLKQEGKGSYFDNLKMDLEIYPSERFSLNADSTYDFLDRAFKEANVDLNFKDSKDRFKASFGHRYARKDSSQSTLSFYYKISPKWEFRNYLRYEYKSGEFKEQQYVLRRDLHCWWMDLGLDVDEESNITIWVIFRVKAFPKVHIGFEHTYRGARKSY